MKYRDCKNGDLIMFPDEKPVKDILFVNENNISSLGNWCVPKNETDRHVWIGRRPNNNDNIIRVGETIIPHYDYLNKFVRNVMFDNKISSPEDADIYKILYKIFIKKEMIKMVMEKRLLTKEEGVILLLDHLQSTFTDDNDKMLSVDAWGGQKPVEEMTQVFFNN